MLTTIQDLEREIEQFHKNIKESNELIRILMSVASLTKTQTESFDIRTQALQDELAKLSPELSGLIQKKIDEFVQTVRDDQQAHQVAINKLMGDYSVTVTNAEMSIAQSSTTLKDELAKLPSDLSSVVQKDIEGFVQTVKTEQQAYQNSVAQLMNSYADKIAHAESIISGFPSTIEAQLKKDRIETADSLKNIQEQYASELSKANALFADQLKQVIENIQSLATQIKTDSAQQYAAFLKGLEKLMDARLTQLAETENHVSQLSQQLETKYTAFVEKLESTNMDQLYKYCQDMNRAINIKLGIALGGVAVAVIVSIISLFI